MENTVWTYKERKVKLLARRSARRSFRNSFQCFVVAMTHVAILIAFMNSPDEEGARSLQCRNLSVVDYSVWFFFSLFWHTTDIRFVVAIDLMNLKTYSINAEEKSKKEKTKRRKRNLFKFWLLNAWQSLLYEDLLKFAETGNCETRVSRFVSLLGNRPFIRRGWLARWTFRRSRCAQRPRIMSSTLTFFWYWANATGI